MAYFAPYIDSSGIQLPTYEDRLSDLCSAYRSIFEQEAELLPGVPEAENVHFAVSGRPFFDACSVRTGEGSAQIRFETGPPGSKKPALLRR